MKDKALIIAVIIFGIVDTLLGVWIYQMISSAPIKEVQEEVIKEPQEYSRMGYYQLTNGVTEDNIQFYVHDSQVYLDDTFIKPVGIIYKRDDGSVYILYNEVEYDLTESDLQVKEVEVNQS